MKSKLYIVLCAALFICAHFKSYSQANTSLSNLTSPTAVNQDLLPNGNNTRSLGSLSESWKTLFIDNNIYLKDSLFINNKGTQNTFVGQRAGYDISTGSNNAAYGFHALYSNGANSFNSAFGSYALGNNTASSNSAFGYRALNLNTTGTDNAATGAYALYQNTTGDNNVATGYQALYSNTSGYSNIAAGNGSLYSNTYAHDNTAIGYNALYYNIDNNFNTAVGSEALYKNNGVWNTATGYQAMYQNTSGDVNAANGAYSLYANTSGNYNSALGYESLYGNTTGTNNVGVGFQTLYTNATGNNNTAVGTYADNNTGNISDATAIGAFTQNTASDQVRVGSSSVTSIGGYVNWTNISDGRVKKNIKQNVPGLDFINKLDPITYNLDLDAADKIVNPAVRKDKDGNAIQPTSEEINSRKQKEQTVYTGFIAQDVEQAAKKLNYDFSGVDAAKNDNDLYGLRYSDFVVPLVKAVQELSKMNDVKDSAITALKNNYNNKISDLQNQIDQLKAMIGSSVNGQQSTISSSASLTQNTPNPFANSTNISYNLPQQYSSAKIIVTDKKGVALKQISLQTKGKGNLQVDASTLAAGAYQYSLYVNNKLIDTKQMVLSR